jgi:hypothetical protein
VVWANIFVLLLCSIAVISIQDPHAKPPKWDEQYAPFIQHVGFLPLARLVTGGLPMMDSATLRTLVNQWRLETHTFHLPCGETMVTLQDVALILGLPIDGSPICGTVTPDGWRDSAGAAIGP